MRCKNMCCISILADPRAKLRVTCFENGRENGINLQDSHRKIFSNMLSTAKSISKYELRDIVNSIRIQLHMHMELPKREFVVYVKLFVCNLKNEKYY